jgi:SHS2 domain-containing protein
VTKSERSAGYEAFEHTADVGLRVWAETLAGLFEQAAAGFINLMLDPRSVERRRSVPVSLEAEEPEELLVAWLEEILFCLEARGLAPAEARVSSLSGNALRGELVGEDFDPKRHAVRQVVKAVTYHNLEVRRVGDGYEVRVIFDV